MSPRAVALLLCIVMVSSAIPLFSIMVTRGTHDAILIAPIHDDANDFARYIHVNNFRFDPLVESPNVPDWLSYGSLDSGVETYYIVQFNGPVTEQMKQDLGSTGMHVLYYINYNAFIVATDGKALDKAKTLASFRWAGVFEPAYKLSPRLSDSYEQMLSRAVERNMKGAPGTMNSSSSGASFDVFSRSLDASPPGFGADDRSSTERMSNPYQDMSLPEETISDPRIDVLVTTFEKSWVDYVARAVSELGGSEIVYSYKSWGTVRATIDKDDLTQLARVPGVMWIDRQTDAHVFNDIARWVIQSADTVDFVTPIHEQGIWGTGQTVTVGDTGIDYDHDAFSDPSIVTPDPNHRKVTDYYVPPGALGDSVDNGINHGSHVSGTVAGDDGTWHVYDGDPRGLNGTVGPHDGQAFDAKLQVQDLSQDGYVVGTPADMHDLFQPALDRGSYIHTNSWGDSGNDYITEASQTDDFLWDNQDFIVLFAAGNSGSGLGSISPYAAAKNVIGVGATENGMRMQTVAGFSSRGPTADGRLKPDVMAPGSGTWSVRGMDPRTTLNNYWQLSGTSMATPTVAGAATLVRQYYMDGFYPTGTKQPGNGFVPSAALVKATLINSASEMTGTGAYANDELKYPNDNQGWGRVLLDDALFFQNDLRGVVVDDERVGLATGGSASYEMAIGDSSMPVEVTLVWTDYPGLPMSSPALVNDLNLVVTSPGGTIYRGNVYQGYNPGESTPNPALSLSDHLNNVESVLVVTNPQVGLWTVSVSGSNVPMGPQPYALVISGEIVTNKGAVSLDKNFYKSSATVSVRTVDMDLNSDPLSIETVTVNLSSSTETVPEVLTLTETGPGTAIFAGIIQLQNYAIPIQGDGLLQVQNGDDITAEYFDDDDGLGGSGPTYDRAVVDDDPPVISGVEVINIRFNRATVVWTTDENSSSLTRYGDSTPPGSSESDSRLSTSHQLMLRNLDESTTYRFAVESTDEAGNLASDDNGSDYYEFTTTVSPPAPVSSYEWPTFHNNMARVGVSPRAFSPPIEMRWNSTENHASRYSSPIMADGMLFSTTLDGYIRARDAYTGDLLWQKGLGDMNMFTGIPTVADGIVYTTFYEEPFNRTGGTVYALDEFTGDVIWSVGPESGIDFNARISMADSGDLVFGAAWSGEVFAMNARTGAIEWTYQTGDTPFSGPAVDGSQVIIGTLYSPRIISLDEYTGSLLWEQVVDSWVTSAPMVSAGLVYVGTYDGTLYCLNKWSGSVVWQVGGFGPFFYSTPATDGASLYFSTGSGICYAVDAFNGSILWNVSIGISGSGSLAYASGYLYLGSYDGALLVLDAFDGSVLDSEPIGDFEITSSPSVSDGWVWIENSYGEVYAFMGQIPVGLVIRPTSQTKDVVPSSVVDYTIGVTNTGLSGPDTFDTLVTPGALGWTTELFKADGFTPLPDTDSDLVPDTGPIGTGNTATVVVRVTIPASVNAGDRESAGVNFRSSINLAVDKDAKIVSLVPPPGVEIGPNAYFTASSGAVRTAWMNVTNTGAFGDTIDMTALPHIGWNYTLLSQDGVTPLPDTDTDGVPDTGPISGLGHVTISVKIEAPSAILPGTYEKTVVTGTSSLDVNVTGSNFVVLEPVSIPSNDWPTFHNGNERHGMSPSLTTPPLDQQWVAGPYLEDDWSGPVFADGILFSTTMDGYIRANDPYTGQLLWSKLLGDEYYYTGTPAVKDGIVYITFGGDSGGSLYALDERTGDTVWSFGSERGMYLNARTPIATSAGLVFGSAWYGEVFAVDANDGSEVWRYQTGDFWPSGVAISEGSVYFSTDDGNAFALDEFTGQRLWSCSLDGEAVSAPMYADGMVYVGTGGGSMYALDSASGDVVWQRNVGEVLFSTPAYDGSAIYFGTENGSFMALNASTGSTLWSVIVGSYVESSVAYANGYVFGTAATGVLYTLAASNGDIVDAEVLIANRSTSSPAVSNGWVWVQDWDGYLYGFKGVPPVGVEVEPQHQEMMAILDSTVAFTVTVRNIGSSGTDTFDVTLSQGPKGWPVAVVSSDGITPLPDTDSDGFPDTGPLGYQNEIRIVAKVSVPAGVVPGDQEISLVTFTSSKDANFSANGTLITVTPPPGLIIGRGGYKASSPSSTEYFATNVTNTGAGLDVIDLSHAATSAWLVMLLESDGVTPLVDNDWDGVPDTGVLGGLVSYPIVVAVSVPESTPPDSYITVTLRATSTVDPTQTASAKFRLDVLGLFSLEWPTYQHDAARTGSAPQPYDLPLTWLWTYDGRGGDSWDASPIVAGGVVYYTSTSGDVMAVDGGTGEEMWVTNIGLDWYTSYLTYSEGKVFVGYTDYATWAGLFSALDAETGMVLWTFSPSGSVLYGTPVTKAGVVYFCTNSGLTYALDAATGDELWEYAVSGTVYWGPSIIDGILVIGDRGYLDGTYMNGTITALDLDGNYLWSLTYPAAAFSGWPSAASGGDGKIFFTGEPGYVYAIDSGAGNPLWTSDTICRFGDSAPVYGDGAIFIADVADNIYALDAETGDELWYFYSPLPISSPAILNNGTVYQVTNSGYLWMLDAATGERIDLMMLSVHDIYSAMAMANGALYVVDITGALSAFGFAGSGEVASIEVMPVSAVVPVGGFQIFDAVAKNRYGCAILGQEFTWTIVSGTGSLMLLDDAGESIMFVAGANSGTTVLRVSIGEISTQVQVVVPPGDVREILVSPSEASVTVGSTMQFTATAYDAFGNEVTGLSMIWTSTMGNIDSSGLLDAGSGSGAGIVTASLGSVLGEATIHVLPGPLDHISVTPNSLSVVAGGVSTISLVGEDLYGNEVAGMTYMWSSTLGEVHVLGGTDEAIFQAGTVAGSGSINVSCGSVSTVISVVVIPGALDSLVIAPSTAAVFVDEVTQFTVSGFDVYGNVISGLTISYTVLGGIGSVNSAGVFTAGTATGAGKVIAISGDDFAEASVTVGHGPLDRIAVFSTSTVTLPAGSVVVLNAVGYDAHGNTVSDLTFTWSADKGSMIFMSGTSEVVYQAGTSVGSRTVTASYGSVHGSMSLSVVPGPLTTLVVDPAALVAHSGDSVNLTVRGYDAYGNPIPNLEFSWAISSTSSINDAIGTLTAHTDTRTVTLATGKGATGTITVTCGDKSAVVSVTVNESPSALTKAAPTLALAAMIAVIALAVLLVLMLLGKLRTVGKKE
ncbi:MAG: PQQ-binding-like beta-propeller repeat protein [Candidatus Thermoplasmatota archaeon]|nr:PQQ-binding-like beta-propeller repeat protein [Candidatus Thermoplasmatota archaeon]